MAHQTWQEHLKGISYHVGTDFHPGDMFADGSPHWRSKHCEIRFPNGSIALVNKYRNCIEAVKVPGKRGYRLHVNGQTHWKKWGRINKGVGPVWADRKGWNTLECPWALWQYCKEL